MTALGLAALVGVQTVINTAMTVGLLPITGLSLPLVSYGGSGLLANGLALGLLVNIALRPGFEVTRAVSVCGARGHVRLSGDFAATVWRRGRPQISPWRLS